MHAHALARDEALYVGGRATSWTGEIDPINSGVHLNWAGELLACGILGDKVRTLVVNMGARAQDGPRDPDNLLGTMERLHGALNSAVRLGWEYHAVEPGVGAIDASGQTVVASRAGAFHPVAGRRHRDHGGGARPRRRDRPRRDGPQYRAAVCARPLWRWRRGQLVKRLRGKAAVSTLDARRADGSLAWRASLPLLATQPALDGNGQVVVVGAGIVALDLEGRTVWSAPSTVPLRAAAFGDGTLAVTRGSELQIVGADGTIRQSLRAGEELTTYPAIAADGTVWVASAKMLYAAR